MILKFAIKYASAVILLVQLSFSQHEHHNHNDSTALIDTLKVKDSILVNPEDSHLYQDQNGNDLAMSHAFSLSLPMNRNGSGTAWLTDNSPMYGYMKHSDGWMLMFHGAIFLRYTSTDITKEGSRGFSRWDAPNWFMAMAQRKIGADGLLNLNLMMSLDRLTEGGDGYPLLFQSGETWEGKPLVDRQHPHDLFSGLSIAYTQRLDEDFDLTAYFGYPGEPALGPVAFMHRVSSSNNPDAPLSHHWQDATHITFGVGTLGIRYGIVKVESSVFTGSEPDEERFGFDKPKFDSYSFRLSVNPNKSFAFQFSQGFLESPEALDSGINVTRTTASLIHSYNFSNKRNISTTLAWGLNNKGSNTDEGHKEHSILLESNFQMSKLAVYGRYEFVQKDAEELNLNTGEFAHDHKFDINALTLGTNYRLFQFANTDISLGLQGSIYFTPQDLHAVYGKNPLSVQLYLKINPSLIGGNNKKNIHSNHKH